MYLCDIHSHTRLSPDSGAELAGMAQAAIDAGLQEFCVTDHFDLVDRRGVPASGFDWPAAKAQYHAAKEAVGGRIVLRLGLELGSTPYDPQAARAALAQGGDELDFVLGSLHNWIGLRGDVDLHDTDFRGDPALCRQAVEHVLDHTWDLVARYPDCYDSLAHIVYPLRYIRRDGMELTLAEYEDRVRAIFTQIAQTGHALEVNTCRGQDLAPWPPLLSWFKECGGELITVGADAHRPEDVAKGIPEALEAIQAAGFRYVTSYAGRKPQLHKL